MLLLRRILVSPFTLAISAVTLAACGQHGALYLPGDPPPGKRPATQGTTQSPAAPTGTVAPAAKPTSP